MVRSVNQAFEEYLRRLTPSKAQREKGAFHRVSVKNALDARLEIGSFFETGSFSHGTGIAGRSDTDVLASVRNPKPKSSYTALEWVKGALTARFPRTPVMIRRPAVVVKFGGGYETWEVVPAFMTGRGGANQFVYDIPGPSAGAAWIDTAPKEHLNYVNECNKVPSKGKAKALARLIKAWKYSRDVPISSFYLEMRCAQYVAGLGTYIHIWDVCLVLEELQKNKLAAINDPKSAAGRIHACSSEATRKTALSRLDTAAIRARKALTADQNGDAVTSFTCLNLLFGGNFPPRYE